MVHKGYTWQHKSPFWHIWKGQYKLFGLCTEYCFCQLVDYCILGQHFMVLYYTNAKCEARLFTPLLSPLFWFNFTFTLSIEMLNNQSAYKSLSWRSTVLKAYIIEAWTLVTGQDSITCWNCVLLDYFMLSFQKIWGKDTFKDSPQATYALQQ